MRARRNCIFFFLNLFALLLIDGIVEEAMTAIHAQGVVHLDWYVSNFMRKIDDESGKLKVKIIDFDSAHVIEDALTDCTATRLVGTRSRLAELEPGGTADLRNYDISLMK